MSIKDDSLSKKLRFGQSYREIANVIDIRGVFIDVANLQPVIEILAIVFPLFCTRTLVFNDVVMLNSREREKIWK